jgi:peptide/nickel transport system substrate-binding protein
MAKQTEKVLVDGASSMSRRELVKALGPAAAAVGLAGCTGGGNDGAGEGGGQDQSESQVSTGGTLNAGMNVGVLTLDGRSVTSLQSMQVMYNIYSKLLDYEFEDDQLKLVGDLATAWEWEDDTTLVFDLAEDAVFHNGEPVTASDVKYTFETMQSKDQYTANLLFSQQVSVEARDEHTAVFDTGDQPFASLESNVGFIVGIINEKADQNADMAEEPVGSGPFKLKEWAKGDHVYLEAFDDYWKTDENGNQLPYIDELQLNIYPDDAVKLRGLKEGELHWIDVVPEKDVKSVLENESLATSQTGRGGFMGIFQFNTQKAPFDDAKVRKAVLHAIDWESYLQVVYHGTAERANNQPLAPETGWNIEELEDPYAKRDIEKAQSLLEESSYDPTEISFTNYVNQGLDRSIKSYEVLQAQLSNTLDIEFDLQLVDKSTVFEKTTNLEFGFSAGAFDGMYDPDQVLTVNLQEGAFFNYGNYVNEEIQELLVEGRQTNDRDERYEAYKRIYEINNEEAGKYYPYWQNLTSAFQPSVKNFQYPYDTCWYFEQVWLDE